MGLPESARLYLPGAGGAPLHRSGTDRLPAVHQGGRLTCSICLFLARQEVTDHVACRGQESIHVMDIIDEIARQVQEAP